MATGIRDKVAIIGMGCFFPKSTDLEAYWRLIFHGGDAVTDVPDTHWRTADYYDADPKKPDHVYCKRGGFLSPVSFDPSAFGIPPNTMEATDTSQLLGLVAAKMALDDAGYGSGRSFDRDRTSVVLGVTGTQELVIPLGARLGHPKWRRALAASGVDPEKVYQAIRGGLAGSTVLDAKMPLTLEGNFKPGFRIELDIKDLANALDTASELGIPVPLSNGVMEIMQALKVDGKGKDDHGGIIQFYEKLAKVQVRR